MTRSSFQQQHQQAFATIGAPTRKDERYKYADLAFLKSDKYTRAVLRDKDDLYDAIHQHRLRHSESALVVMVNGYFISALSDLHKLPHDMIICSIETAFEEHDALIKPHLLTVEESKGYPFASQNAANLTSGLFMYVPDHKKITIPVHLLTFTIGEDNIASYPHHVIVLGQESELHLFDEYVAFNDRTYLTNSVMTMAVAALAKLTYCKLQQESMNAAHLAHIFVKQMENSETHFINFSKGAKFSRDDLNIKLLEQGASCHTSGFYRTSSNDQYCDQHVDILHLAPNSESDMLYKGILDNKSKAVFNGRLYVEKDAQKIIAYQANHNLLLSDQAEVYSKPELEIYADDVKCKHGASTGQIDQDALFYLQSRGIARNEALDMLFDGFAEEVMLRVNHVGMLARIQEVML
jgi:Fe-S cluster assembly protein SufD